jgi:hypothetical protein
MLRLEVPDREDELVRRPYLHLPAQQQRLRISHLRQPAKYHISRGGIHDIHNSLATV